MSTNDPQGESQDPQVFVSGQQFQIDGAGNVIYGAPARKRRLRMGCLLWAIALGVLIPVAIGFLILPLFRSGFGLADTRPVPGDPRRFDPVAALPGVRDYAGEKANLVSISAYYVRADGTMDLNASYDPKPNVTYEFYREASPPENAPPVGAGGTAGGAWYEKVTISAYEPGQWRHVTRIGGGVSTEYSYENQGMERDIDSPTATIYDTFVPDPACSFTRLWSTALERGAPADAVAIIEYDSYGYDFSISGADISLEFDQDCKLR